MDQLKESHRLETMQTVEFRTLIIEILGALTEATKIQTEQTGQILAALKQQANAFGQLRRALQGNDVQ